MEGAGTISLLGFEFIYDQKLTETCITLQALKPTEEMRCTITGLCFKNSRTEAAKLGHGNVTVLQL